MKELRTKRMRSLLKRAIRKTRGLRPPHDGYCHSLIYETLPNGWHYQVDWVHDTRFREKPWVAVHAFAPPRDFSARAADFVLESQS